MKPTFQKSMIWLHTYVGLLFGWLIFSVFLTGTLSYYNSEITHWIEGGSQTQHAQSVSQLQLVQQGVTQLAQAAPKATAWTIRLPNERGEALSLSYRKPNQRRAIYLQTSVSSSTESAQHTRISNGGNFFRTFHYTLSLHNWGGRYITGVVAMCMLLAVFSGIYTHRRFFKDFFTLRQKGWDKQLKDIHAIFGVISIPFCFVICFSALLIYINLYVPFVIKHHFDGYRQLNAQVSTSYPRLQAHDEFYATPELSAFFPQLQQAWGADFTLKRVVIDAPLDTHARVVFYQQAEHHLSNKPASLAFSLSTRELVPMPEERTARQVRRLFYGLHEAHFAGPLLRILLFSLGMVSTLLIASGMVIWVQKRRAKRQRAVDVWVEKLNLGVLYGLPLAVASYLLVSRLPFVLPSALKSVELQAFFYTWLGSVLLCIVCKPRWGKPGILCLNAVFYSGLLILDSAADTGGLWRALHLFDQAYLTLSGLLLLTASYFIYEAISHFRRRRDA